jgi:hypothetical protein
LNYGKTSEHDGFESQTFGDGPSDPKLPEDVNFDGTVNAYDLAIVLSNLNTGSGCAFNQVNQFNLLDSLFK